MVMIPSDDFISQRIFFRTSWDTIYYTYCSSSTTWHLSNAAEIFCSIRAAASKPHMPISVPIPEDKHKHCSHQHHWKVQKSCLGPCFNNIINHIYPMHLLFIPRTTVCFVIGTGGISCFPELPFWLWNGTHLHQEAAISAYCTSPELPLSCNYSLVCCAAC